MKVDLTDDQYHHLLIALTMARVVMTDMGPWEIDDTELHAQQLAMNEDLYRLLLKKEVVHGTH